MDNLNPDSKPQSYLKIDSVNDVDSVSKTEQLKKKVEKNRKEENKLFPINSDELVAIGTSTCGRWVKFQQRLGEGGYKTVFKGYDREKGNNVAWCEFKPHHVDTKEKQVNMMNEIEIMVRMDHPNIVTCYDVFDEYIDMHNPSNPFPFKSIILIQELMGEGTLKSVIKKNFINGKLILKLTLIAYWLHQIVSALNYMHDKLNPPIIHRDLKADNCFLESKSSEKYLNVKVGDFGLAKQLGKKEKNTMLGTVGFMAPEVYDEKYDAKIDIYAFGMLMLEVVTNRTPYDDCETVMQVAKETMSGKLPEIFNLVHDQGTREVISCCIHPLPSYRPSAMELFYHPIFLNKNEDELKDMLPVEITPNFDKCIDREAMVNYFVANMISESGDYNTKFNLRMDFRDKQLQRSLNLDEGESLEFDLDVYKEEDIPELIANLKSEYDESMREGLNANKNIEAKQINIQLETLFKSMELQMQFLLKMIIGKRWFYILDLILSKQTYPELKDDVTGFSLLASYKMNWQKASKQLEIEISEYSKLGNSDEMKKILKTYKTPDVIQNETPLCVEIDNIKADNKSQEPEKIQDYATSSKPQKDSDESTSFNLQIPGSVFSNPNQPMYYPTPLYYNNIPGSFLNNQFNSPFCNPIMHQNQNIMDPMDLYIQNQEILNRHIKKTQTAKNELGSNPPIFSNASQYQKMSLNDKPEQHQNEDLLENADKILTFEEVMKYVSSKSHRHSRHPFIVIPVLGQSNAFKLVKVTEYKPQENKIVKESVESSNKMGCNIRNRTCNKQNDSENIPIFYNFPPCQTYSVPPGMIGYQYPNFQACCPVNIPICTFQYWMQQQYYMQYLQQQQYQQTSLIGKSPINSVYSPFNESSLHHEKLSVNINERNESMNTKFLVTTIEEKPTPLSNNDDPNTSNTTLPIIENLINSNIKKQENIKKNEKENNCNLDMTKKNFNKTFIRSINSHGENTQSKQAITLRHLKQNIEKDNQFNSLDSQTLSFTNSVTTTGEMHTLGPCRGTSFHKAFSGLFRSSTYDFAKDQVKKSENVNLLFPVRVPKCLSATSVKKIHLSKEKKI